MRKAKLLIAVLVCSVMFMGVGYAWWTDTLTVSGNISTGEMKVQFGRYCMKPFTMGTMVVDEPEIKVSKDGKRLDCTVTNILPGAVGVLKAEVINSGTVPVKFDSIEVTLNGSKVFMDQLQVGLFNPNDREIVYYNVNEFITVMNNSDLKNEVIMNKENFLLPEMFLRLNPEVGNETQKQKGSFCVKFNWIQFDPIEDAYKL